MGNSSAPMVTSAFQHMGTTRGAAMKRFVPLAVVATILAALVGARGPLGTFWATDATASLLFGVIGEEQAGKLAGAAWFQ